MWLSGMEVCAGRPLDRLEPETDLLCAHPDLMLHEPGCVYINLTYPHIRHAGMTIANQCITSSLVKQSLSSLMSSSAS